MFKFIESIFVSEAWAMAPPQGAEGAQASPLQPLIFFGIMIALMYFILIRPQQKQQKRTQEMQASIKKGDKVITSGGIYGLVEKTSEKTVTLKVAENTMVKFGRQYIASVRSTEED
jgi:preprotein translocase subunit YajC